MQCINKRALHALLKYYYYYYNYYDFIMTYS